MITFDTLDEMGILYNNGLIFDTNMCSIIAVSNCHHMPEDIELLVFCRLGDAFRVCMKTIDLKVPSNMFLHLLRHNCTNLKMISANRAILILDKYFVSR